MSSSLPLWYVRLDSYSCFTIHFSLFRRTCSSFYNSFFFCSGGWHPWQDGDASAADPGHLHCGEKLSNKKRCLTTIAIGKSLWSQLNYLFLEKTYKTTAVRCSLGGRPDGWRAKTVQKNAFHTFCLSVTVKVSNTVENQRIRIMSIFEEFH